MKFTELIRAQKTITASGLWSSGKMTRGAFPLSKSGNKAYRLGNRRWRVVEFSAVGMECRLLVNYSASLGQFQAMLGVVSNGDTKVVVCLEHHPTHDDWHLHGSFERISAVAAGIKRGPWVRRLQCRPNDASPEAQHMTDDLAYRIVVDAFRLDLASRPAELRLSR